MLICLIALGIELDPAGVSRFAFVTSVVSRGNSCIATDPRHQPPMLATAIHVAAAAGLGGMAGLLGGLFGVGGGFPCDTAALVSSMAWISKRRRAPP